MASTWRLQRLPSASPVIALAARAAAILLALAITGIILAISGFNPVELASEAIDASFGSSFGLQDIGVLLIPLILTGLSVALGPEVGAWNIGAEGKFYAGAFATAAVGLFVPGPPVV